MKMPRPPGRYNVVVQVGDRLEEYDFDAQEWSYAWIHGGAYPILRLMHDNVDTNEHSFEYREFISPVSVGYIPEEE